MKMSITGQLTTPWKEKHNTSINSRLEADDATEWPV